MELLSQPFNGQLGTRLIQLLDSSEYQRLNIIVAFANNGGVLRIKDALERFRTKGGAVNAYVGVDLHGTSYEALTTLLPRVDSLHIVHSEKWQTFHTKIYNFVADDKSLVVIGSHNLTTGGLWTNFESSALIPVSLGNQLGSTLQDGVDEYIEHLAALGGSIRHIKEQKDIDRLLENKYVLKEVAERVLRRREPTRGYRKSRLFGNGLTVKIPHVDVPKHLSESSTTSEPPLIRESEEGQTIWFETRAMTGGSRNILDLSMKSLVSHGSPLGTPYEHEDQRYMRGAVEFFGIEPPDITKIKEITINFEGVDYMGNTLLYPEGDKANGTWRLQIKGVDISGRKITEVFRAKGEASYLRHKILAFTKVEEDYYYMSVFPASALEQFSKAASILAYNGSTVSSRLLGLL